MKVRDIHLRYKLSHPKDMPREKIQEQGVESLSDRELLAVILRTGTQGRTVFQLASSILRQHSLSQLLNLSYSELVATRGIGRSKASTLLSCFEFAKRALSLGTGLLPTIKKPEDAVALAFEIATHKKENLLGLYLNGRNQVVFRDILSVGTLDASIVHPREVFRPGLQHHATGVLLVHNHPSGDNRPSRSDIEVTQRLVRASEILGIRLVDHIIVSGEGFSSLKSLGHLT